MATPESQGGIDYRDGGFPAGTEIYPLTSDLAELAIRMGNPVSVDRRGNVVLLEDFSCGKSMVSTASAGLGEDAEIYGNFSRYGGYTLRLHRVADASSWVGFLAYVPMRSAGLVAVEVIFTTMTGAPNLKLYLERFTGTKEVQVGLRWDGTNGATYIGGDIIGWTATGDNMPIYYNNPIQNSMKIVLDESEEEYVRGYVAGQAITIPTTAAETQASAVDPLIRIQFYNGLDPTDASSVYVDAIIVTCNE